MTYVLLWPIKAMKG